MVLLSTFGMVFCCKNDTNYYDKNQNLWSMDISEGKEVCKEYNPNEKLMEYNINIIIVLEIINCGIFYNIYQS